VTSTDVEMIDRSNLGTAPTVHGTNDDPRGIQRARVIGLVAERLRTLLGQPLMIKLLSRLHASSATVHELCRNDARSLRIRELKLLTVKIDLEQPDMRGVAEEDSPLVLVTCASTAVMAMRLA
jgi:hypothetical protein